MILISVDLPAPLSPIRPSTSPASILQIDVGQRLDGAEILGNLAQLEQTHRALSSVPQARGRTMPLFQDQVAVEPALARRDHREAALDPLVEREALDALELGHLRLVAFAAARGTPAKIGISAGRIVHHLHVEGRARDELVQRHERQHRRRHPRRGRHAVHADHRSAARHRGIVRVDDREFVAMAHRPQRGQQLRREQRIDVLQHPAYSSRPARLRRKHRACAPTSLACAAQCGALKTGSDADAAATPGR